MISRWEKSREETKGRFCKKGGCGKCTLIPVFGTGEHPNVRSFGFWYRTSECTLVPVFANLLSGNRKRCRQTGSRQSTPLSTIRTRYGNSASTPGATRTGKNQQNALQKGSRHRISVSIPHRRYGHRLRTPFLRTPFPRLLVGTGEHPPKPPFLETTLLRTPERTSGSLKGGGGNRKGAIHSCLPV